MKRVLLALTLCASIVCGCSREENGMRKQVRKDLSERLSSDASLKEFFNVDYKKKQLSSTNGYVSDASLTDMEIEALEFLYAYMPLADFTDYPTDFYLQSVRSSLKTRAEMPWGVDVPDPYFMHFVLPLRVNNENLDTARVSFYKELKPRVEGLSPEQAILEVNRWCHEKVTYQPSDGRTSAPLSTVRTSYGRCGEESTFTVAALRSVGIPARQVYTPRWAHTDDNHAWVEAWANGKWHFIGACEPEPVLDLGWFNVPASRGMLMHTKVFGRYKGPEEVVLNGTNFTEINLIENYADTGEATVSVVDESGKPVEKAKVYFCIYNYAEFYPALYKFTDENGQTKLSAGLGCMLAWAVKDGKYGFERIYFGKDENVKITLRDKPESEKFLFDIVPPLEGVELPEVTPEQRAEADRRSAIEDSLRNSYMATFYNPETAENAVKAHNLPAESGRFLVGAAGNHKVIETFLRNHPDQRAIEQLGLLSRKDLHDVTPEVLEDDYNAKESVLGQRVALEFLTPYKKWFLENISKEDRAQMGSVEALVDWTSKNIKIIDDPTAWKIPMSPISVYKLRSTYEGSRDIFFVSLARTLGFESRIDPVTSKVQYGKDGEWIDVTFGKSEQKSNPKGRLILSYVPTKLIENPGYYKNFSISKIVDGMPHLLSFDEGEVDMGGGMDYQAFKDGVTLDEGTYILASGNRLSDGSVPVTVQIFTIKEGQDTKVELEIRQDTQAPRVLGMFSPEATFTADGESSPSAIKAKSGDATYILGVLEVGKEPTNHIMRDLAAKKADLEKWGHPIILLCTDSSQLERLKKETSEGRYGNLPSNIILGLDTDSVKDKLIKGLNRPNDNLPIFIISNPKGEVYFVSQGYTIGLGNTLYETLLKL